MVKDDPWDQDARVTERLGVGLLGTGFMADAHTRALALLPAVDSRPAARPSLAMVCSRTTKSAQAFARQHGFAAAVTDWREMIADPTVVAFDNVSPNAFHAEPTIAAAHAGKAVLCEKPLAPNMQEAGAMLTAVRETNVVNMCAFNYRFFPAIRIAHSMIQAGTIGRTYAFRSRFLVSPRPATDPSHSPWRMSPSLAGIGVVGDTLSHHIDLARYLVGELASVTAVARRWTPGSERTGLEDAVVSTVEFANGAIGTMEASCCPPGHALESVVEIDGSRGSLAFSVRNPNYLLHHTPRGTHYIDITEPGNGFPALWWPPGHALGWADSFVHELRHFLGACAGAWTVEPHGATFEDGYRCAIVCAAILHAAQSDRRIAIRYPSSPPESQLAPAPMA